MKLDKIIVMDDGSAEPVVPFDAPGVEWVRQPNVGKRGAQVAALRRFGRDEFQFVMTVDSDSTPYPDALEHLLRAMSNKKVQAATGWIYVRNYRDSLVARAADIDIGGSCVMMRASRSMLGALETTSGALALYRSEILYDHLDEYAVECGTGDDRWLAMRALLRGQVVGVYEAGVETDMPATLRGTFRQRLRWARSWWWMLPFAYARLNLRQLASPTVGLIELVITPLVLLWAITSWVIGLRLRLSHPEAALAFIGAYAVIRFALSVLYLAGRPGMSRRQKMLSLFAGTPAAVLLNLLLLMPTRYYALARLGWNPWGYRHTPARTFVAAWRHLVTVFRQQGAGNVIWLWTVNITDSRTGPVQDWWPGAAYVTWVGIDGYYFKRDYTFANAFLPTIAEVRIFTRRPILLSETGVGQVAGQAAKIPDLFAGVRASHLLGFVWFDRTQADGLYHQDWRLEGHQAALAAFRRALRTYQDPAPAGMEAARLPGRP